MQRCVVVCWALLVLVTADHCPDGGRCTAGQTCCKSPANGYECCPFNEAECCEDHIHCCPTNTVCDVAASGCVNATVFIPWKERTSADKPSSIRSFRMIKTNMGEEDDNICPDQSRCPAEFSCLRALTRFGCCPLAQGISCSDGKHCCPEGHQCSSNSRSCIKKDVMSVVLCSDGVSECPDDTTCCQNPAGDWGCCPLPKAVCCDDKLHCCPEGSTCDVEHSKCISINTKKEMPMWAKLPARVRAEWENQKDAEVVTAATVGAEKVPEVTTAYEVPYSEKDVSVSSVTKTPTANVVTCSDSVGCPDEATCCQSPEGEWECCPLPQAISCEDHIHCCPHGYTCNLIEQKCDADPLSVPWVKKVPGIQREVKIVQCDDVSGCPDGTTCCKTEGGSWACCPLPEAVCCSDHVHCCPHGQTCNLAAQTCDDGLQSVPWLEKIPTIQKQGVQVKDVPCDDTEACPDGSTCCKTEGGSWACCPLPEAVCCSDHVHCCPHGQTCNLAAQTCDDGLQSVPWLEKIPTIQKQGVQVKDVPCDDTEACPDGSTCCKTEGGSWACCPLPEAVCCSDHVHCCPHGQTCNLAAQTCDDGLQSVPWLEKIPTIQKQGVQVKDVPCDNTEACPDGSTCCKTEGGSWACCPLPEAVCCSDHVHCCPHGQTCNLAAQTCDDGLQSVPWLEKIPTIQKQGVQVKDVPCDDTEACPDGTTCCKTEGGSWACCPLPEAVCCSDHVHCCPHGQTCNLAAQTCDDGLQSVPWLEKIPTIQKQGVQVKDVPCDDTEACPDGSTCCKTEGGSWACCPLPEAVCCSDHVHCCPHGQTCNLAAQTCDDGLQSVPWLEKIPTIQKQGVQVKDVPCDDTEACPDGSTCCKTEGGSWACCPLPEAVCCSDHVHCCPHGQTCNLAAQTCDDGLQSVPWLEKIPTIQKQGVQVKDVPCDDTEACPDGSTCCKTEGGSWACCPLPEAVCCSDHVHCCPHGQTCNLAAQTCDDGLQSVPWLEKIPTIQKQGVQVKDVPCDDTEACPDGSTCCKTEGGSWACCPLPEAVCCSDHVHCCPHGQTCNLAAQTCDDGLQSVPWLEKIPTIQKQGVQVKDVPCDDTEACPDGSTCCKTEGGSWACCPLPKAVCCSDHEHCCPSGSTCNLASLTCDTTSGSTPMERKTPTFTSTTPKPLATTPITEWEEGEKEDKGENKEEEEKMESEEDDKDDDEDEEEEDDKEDDDDDDGDDDGEAQEHKQGSTPIQCDATTSCPQLTTCCYMTDSQTWGCCPLPRAVCCSGGSNCCPEHYTCDHGGRSCRRGRVLIPWYTKVPATRTSAPAEPNSVRCGGSIQCPERTTCCKMMTGEWGCCPLTNAVCCPDMEHCCPQGYTCNMASGSCQKPIMLQLDTVPLTPVFPSQPLLHPLTHKDSNCDETMKCGDGQTCCRISATAYGCCSYPNGACCSDKRHCCPNGYTCSEVGDCVRDIGSDWQSWHFFLNKRL